ncbi:MAG: DUF4926 domain-containing protein [Planctomycetota bacterium]
MSYAKGDTVVLMRSLPGQGLRRGALGTVLQVDASGRPEVEFRSATGQPLITLTLAPQEVRPVTSGDTLVVHSVRGGFWARQFLPLRTAGQTAFDVILGMALPVFCFAADPIVFRSSWHGESVLARYACSAGKRNLATR